MMVQVCNGAKTKSEMIDESVEQYKHVFVLARNNFNRIVEVFGYPTFVTNLRCTAYIVVPRAFDSICLATEPSKGTLSKASIYQMTTMEMLGVVAGGAEEEGEVEVEGMEEEGVQVPQEAVVAEQLDDKRVSGFTHWPTVAVLTLGGLISFSSAKRL